MFKYYSFGIEFCRIKNDGTETHYMKDTLKLLKVLKVEKMIICFIVLLVQDILEQG